MPDDLKINIYAKELTQEEIRLNKHRDAVGGFWEEMGTLQFEYLVNQGLQPNHRLLDIGCGSLRGGIHFVNYLESGNYFGVDINQSLLDAGIKELADAGLSHKQVHLAQTSCFDVAQFGRSFEFLLAQSLFTHLPFNHIIRCLTEAKKVMTEDSKFFATVFIAPTSGHLQRLEQLDGIMSQYDSDPYHQSLEELKFISKVASLRMEFVGQWNHPRNQQMLVFRI